MFSDNNFDRNFHFGEHLDDPEGDKLDAYYKRLAKEENAAQQPRPADLPTGDTKTETTQANR